MDQEDYELAKLKVERIIKLSETFEDMNEDDFKRFLTIVESVLSIVPKKSVEKEELGEYLGFINNMNFKKFGYVFKGVSNKGSVMLNKKDVEQMVWLTHSFLY